MKTSRLFLIWGAFQYVHVKGHECDVGFTGVNCEIPCSNFCTDNYPYGCSTNQIDKVKYGCSAFGDCVYLVSGQDYPNDGFCTYKDETPCPRTSENDCEQVGSRLDDGSCPDSTEVPDGTNCISELWGMCEGGVCKSTGDESCKDDYCSGQGSCITYENHGVCECDVGFTGDNCEIPCVDFCPEDYPYGCSTSLINIVKYGCSSGGGCNYLPSGQGYTHDGYCTYKDDENETPSTNCENADQKFLLRKPSRGLRLQKRTCRWLMSRTEEVKERLCLQSQTFNGIEPANRVCRATCASC